MCNFSDGVYEAGVKQGMERGIAQGLERGMERGFGKVVANMLSLGKTPVEIEQLTGLPMEKIKELAASL